MSTAQKYFFLALLNSMNLFFAHAAFAESTVIGTVTLPDGNAYQSTLNATAYLQPSGSLLDPLDAHSGSVQSNGSFSITMPGPGDYYIFVLPSTTSDYSFSADGDLVQVTDNTTVDVGTVALTETEFRGTVYSSVDEEKTPLEDVRVEVTSSDGRVSRSMYTLSDGSYNIGGVADEIRALGEELSGISVSLGAIPDNHPNFMNNQGIFQGYLTENQPIEENDITLQSAPKHLKGTVKRTDGTPVNGAEVAAFPIMGGGGKNDFTDEEGEFEMYLTGGQWNVDVNPDYYNTGAEHNWAYFEPPTTVIFANNEESETEKLSFEVIDAEIVVKGKAKNNDGKIPTGADISLVDGEGNGLYTKVNGETAEFKVFVPPGTYTLKIVPLPDRNDDQFNLTTFLAAPTDKEIDLGTITGLTMDATIQGTVYQIEPNGQTSPVSSNVSVEAWDLSNRIMLHADTDPSGEYSITVYEGTWLITTHASQSDLTVRVSADETSKGNDLVITPLSATIEGNIFDEEGDSIELATGIVPYATAENGEVYSGEMEPNGNAFRVEVPANETHFTVSASFDPGSDYTVEEPVTNATPGEIIKLTLLQETKGVTGTIKDSEGNTITNLNVKLAFTNNGKVKQTVVDSDTGTYSVELSSGTWLVSYQIEEKTEKYLQRNIAQEVEVTKDGMEKDITIPSNIVEVSGTVTDVEGEPVFDAQVTISNHAALEEAYQNGEPIAISDLIQTVVRTDSDGMYTAMVPEGEYRISVSNHVEQEIPGAAVDVMVSETGEQDVDFQYQESTARLEGKVQRGETAIVGATIKVFGSNGYTNVTETNAKGEYRFSLVDGEYAIEGFLLDEGALFRSGQQTVTVSGDTEKNLFLLEDAVVEVPTAEKISFDATKPQFISLGDALSVHIPAYTVDSSGEFDIFITPTLNINELDSNSVVGFGYEALIFDSDNIPVYSFNQDVVVKSHYQQSVVEQQGFVESALLSRIENPSTDAMQEPGVEILNTKDNDVYFLQNHFSAIALTSAVQGEVRAAQAHGLQVKQRANAIELKWKKTLDAIRYTVEVRAKGGKLIKKFASTKKLEVTLSKKLVTEGKQYKFRVRGVAASGKAGQWSSWRRFQIK